METWRQFRAELARLMREGDVTVAQVVKATRPAPDARGPSFTIGRETLYGYLRDREAGVGNGAWQSVEALLRCIDSLAADKGHALDIDYARWEESWQNLRDRQGTPGTRQDSEFTPRLSADTWIGGWDGAAGAVLACSSAQEFVAWPAGQERLDALAQAVARLSAACEPELARDAASRLVAGAEAEFGETSPKTLAARHALAFWTGHTHEVRSALQLTTELHADCLQHLGAEHILTRLAALRKALWLGHMGRWHEANRLYAQTVHSEAALPDRDRTLWLLARWGMARTGGRSGNWIHAHIELDQLLPEMIAAFGPGDPAVLAARHSHAWAAARAGHHEAACTLLARLADQADAAVGPGHLTSLRIRISLAYWAQRCGSAEDALSMATAVRKRCEALLGPDHSLSTEAAEVEALCRLDADPVAAIDDLRGVASRREQHLGHGHPHTVQAWSNYAAVRATIDGPLPVLGLFRDLARESGHALGEDHPETLRVRMNLAIATLEIEGTVAARPLCARVVESLRRVLGDEHPETVLGRELLQGIDREEGPGPDTGHGRMQWFHSQSAYGTYGEAGGAGSDRALKCDIDPVMWPPDTDAGIEATGNRPTTDGYAVLRAVAALPVSTWSYRGEEGVRHLGPMAQDWYAALGLGADDRTIHPIDANGVSVVAVQALYRWCAVSRRR
ncbi:tail fiber domain-containing protein [Streptomyces azureus]|uniref:Putative ATP/GTP binding protein n=1 Tax=Streptomyces azureus TaxID=146537 RepID=A0A0K8PN76_STRAJ|nr:tail fiber domain-containing protein [Streptomyces azureus]GAP49337.1 putative ATP/GTP binding protein [Streptomyces azureus]